MLACECGYRQGVAVHAADRLHNVLDHLDNFRTALQIAGISLVLCVSPVSRYVDLLECGSADVDSLVVHINDVLALLQVGLGSSVLHELNSLLARHYLSQCEECRLQNGVGALAHADLDSEVDCVDGVKLNVVLSNVALLGSCQMLAQLFRRPLAVDEEYAARLNVTHDREVLGDVGRVVACYEVSLVDVVRRTDRLVAKTQMRNGYAAGLLGVVLEVSLYELVGVVADDLDGVLVCTNGTVAAETPELALGRAFCCGVRCRLLLEGEVGNVVVDAQGEHLLRLCLSQLLVYSEYGGRGRILGTQTVTAAGYYLIGDACISQSGNNVHVKRLALGARLLGAVEDCDLLSGLRDSCDQLVSTERTVQTNLNQADLLAVCVQVIDNFLCNVADGAHSDDNAVSVSSAVVVEQLVVGAELGIYLAHVLLNDARNSFVVLVGSLAVLEEYVAVLVRAAHHSVLRVQCALAECFNSIHVAHFLQILVIPNLNLLDLVGGTEAVEEVDERNTGLDGSQMCYCRKVHNLLRVGLSQHSETGLAASHNVGMVTEDVQCMRCNGTSGNVEYTRKQLACDLVHIRDHQQKTLRSGVGGGQRTCCQRTVYGTRRTCLGLHFDYLNGSTENVLLTCGSPLVNAVCHGAGRGDRIDTRNFGKRVRYVRGRSVAVHGLHLSCHVDVLL